jgi:hypothetical protein
VSYYAGNGTSYLITERKIKVMLENEYEMKADGINLKSSGFVRY